jgi:hypothetical protein
MGRKKTVLVLVLAVVVGGSAAWSQGSPDLSGPWTFQTSMTVPLPAGVAGGVPTTECFFEGTAQVTQDPQGQLSGTAAMTLVRGEAPCPAESSAQVTGGLDGAVLFLTLDGGNFGVAYLTGQETTGAALTAGPPTGILQPGYEGTLGVETGPFAGVTGSWIAFPGTVAESIPTIGALGAAGLVLLLVTAALLSLRARSGLA